MAMLAAKSSSGVSPSIGSPGGTVTSTESRRLQEQEKIRIGTWNVTTMSQAGKIHNTIQEMTRMKIDILGISEMRWPGSGSANILDHQVYYSGTDNNRHEKGVGIILTKKMAGYVSNFIPVSDRVMLVQMKARPVDINIIQVYAPTADKGDEEVLELYHSINEIMKKLKKEDVTIVMGDFNAKLGAGKTSEFVGAFGLGERNTRGDELEMFAETHQLAVMNTWFRLPPRRLYTWISPMDKPGRIVRNQIDYIMVNARYRNSCTAVKTYPGADIQSTHVPLVSTFKIKMKKPFHKKQQTYDLRRLKDENIREKVKAALKEKISNNPNTNNIETELANFQQAVQHVKEEHLKPDRRKRKQWMTDEILELMEHRRREKGNPIGYKGLQNTIRRKIREAKEREKQEQCMEVEFYQSRYDDFNVHRKVKEITGKIRKKKWGKLVDDDGNLVVSKDEQKEVWKKYLENLFYDTRERQEPDIPSTEGPTILRQEIELAIKQTKEGKAAGLDQVQAEFFKLFDDKQMIWLTSIFNSIHASGKIPNEWLKSEFITLPKKPGAKVCGDYRTISLMSHILKLFLKVIHRRIYRLCEDEIAPNQFGFRNAVGTREALFSVQVLFQKCRDVSCDVYACLIDYQKAFDRVKHEKMIEILKKTGIDGKDLKIISNLYWHQTASLKIEDENTDEVEILRGVRQGCILSPSLFNLYSEHIFREALDNLEEGISINGLRLNNLRYADDTIIFADTIEGLQRLMNKIHETSTQYGLDINTGKTKFMIISKKEINGVNLFINNTRIERVTKYTYLGTSINESWDNSQEIKSRIGKARSIFNSMSAAFKSHNLTLDTKVRLLRCYVFSVLLYGVETWTLTKDTSNRLEAFELWLYRRILKISWTQKVTNVTVLQRMKKTKELLNTVKCRKLQYLGHIMRNPARYELLQLILQGKIDSKREPGRRRISWLANLRTWFGKSSTQLFRIAVDKVRIAMMVAHIRNG
uniref:Craniofacial development protein 2 n=3 Tax=Cacopsylla melanoneura TaxID=428564 RepID=A0A8D8Y176_9HEMI